MKQNCIRIAYGGVASQAWGAVPESLLSSIITLLGSRLDRRQPYYVSDGELLT